MEGFKLSPTAKEGGAFANRRESIKKIEEKYGVKLLANDGGNESPSAAREEEKGGVEALEVQMEETFPEQELVH